MDPQVYNAAQDSFDPHVQILRAVLRGVTSFDVYDPRTNVFDQMSGGRYSLPLEEKEEAAIVIEDQPGLSIRGGPTARVFYALEECRRRGTCLHFCERQYFAGPDGAEISSSCIELDFDVYQRSNQTRFDCDRYMRLAEDLFYILLDIADLSTVATPIYIAVLRKDVRAETHPKHGNCYKDSFHMRFYVRIEKALKLHFIEAIKSRGVLAEYFPPSEVFDADNVLDRNSYSVPVMILGSAKRRSIVPHQLYALFYMERRSTLGGNWRINVSTELNKVGDQEEAGPHHSGRKRPPRQVPVYKHNLCWELSLHFEVPANFAGLIRKPWVRPKGELLADMQTLTRRLRDDIISPSDHAAIKRELEDLCAQDHEAHYIVKCIECLSEERLSRYDSWRDLLMLLAQYNPDYRIIGVYASTMCPQSWVNDGERALDNIWRYAVANASSITEPRHRRIQTLYHWAKTDNPERYALIQEHNLFRQILDVVYKTGGKLNDTQLADLIQIAYPGRFAYDDGAQKPWYEFVFPSEARYGLGAHYKWRADSKAVVLDNYISRILPERIREVARYMQQNRERANNNVANTDAAVEYCDKVNAALLKLASGLGETARISRVLSRCAMVFYHKDFGQSLDRDPQYLGVHNGVLRLYPTTELIQSYNTCYVSRSVNAPYKPYDKNDPKVRELRGWIRQLFADESSDAFQFVMMYLASSLDGRKKKPLLFIWLGEGANGKSFLLELQIHLMQHVMRQGYAFKFNVCLLTHDRTTGGPDSEKAAFEFARFAYCSETNEGETLLMARIKEMTSETMSCNEKFKTQAMFEIMSNFVFCSNFDPKISGSDYGTWRRLLTYTFKVKFKADPDPNNPLEKKDDPRLLREVVRDPEYLQAYLSILVHYYEKFRDKYGSNLDNIPKPTIDRETEQFRQEQDAFSRFVETKLRKARDGEVPRKLTAIEIANEYLRWYDATVGGEAPSLSNVKQLLRKSKLRNDFKGGDYGEPFLDNYIMERSFDV